MTRSTVFAIQRKIKNRKKLNITCKDTKIKQTSQVTYYLDCVLNETMSGRKKRIRKKLTHIATVLLCMFCVVY